MTVALVTGAAQGIGAEVADRLAAEGARVARWDVRPGAGGEEVDVSSAEQVAAALRRVRAELGTPSLVVTAAGIMWVRGFLDLPARDWERTLAVNLTGTFLVLQACAAAMVEDGIAGRIVGVASIAGRGPRADAADYAASKAGVISLVRSAAVALAPHGITVNAVCPGIVDTPMTQRNAEARAARQGGTAEDALRSLVERVPLGRIQTPADVADVIMFFLSDRAGYVTGQALNACGGIEFG